MNNIMFICGIVMACGTHTATAGTWTLEQTISAAITTSNRAAEERLAATQAEIDADIATHGRYPSASFTTQANVVSEVMEMSAVPGRTIQFGDYDSYAIALQINQVLYDGGRLSSVKEAALSRAEAARLRAQAAELATGFMARAAFFSVLMAERQRDAALQARDEAELHLRDVLAKYREEMVLETDVAGARLRVTHSEMEIVSRETALDQARSNMRAVTGMGIDEDIVLVWNDQEARLPGTDIDTALGNRPEIAAFRHTMTASEQMAKSARAASKPSLGFFGGINYGRPGLDMVANEWMHYFSAGVALKWDIWDWREADKRAEQALIGSRQAEHELDEFTRELSRQLSDARSAYTEAIKRRELSVQSAEYARRRLELTEKAYREGMATETDYDAVHSAYARTITEESASEVAVHIAAARIAYVMGIRNSGGTQ